MLKIEIPQDNNKLKEQIAALKWAIENDTNEKDRNIHKKSLKELQEAFKKIQ